MPGLLIKQGTMPALKEKLSAEVQEVVQLSLTQSHPTFRKPELKELLLSIFPPEVVARLLSSYHDLVITARAPRRPTLVALLRCTWVSFSEDLLARRTKHIRSGLRKYAKRDRERITRARWQVEHPDLLGASRPPSLTSQSVSE